MDYQAALQKLSSIQQQHLLHHWNTLSAHEQTDLLKQIEVLDIPTFTILQNTISTHTNAPDHYNAFTQYTAAGDASAIQFGQKLLSSGKVGCLLVAGGQGSRLRFDAPKGMYPISPIRRKSLFQLFAEKTIAASQQANRKLPLAIMTSPDTHRQTETFFQENHYFGLDPDQLSIFMQGELPFLDTSKNLFLETPDKIAEGPDGNGGSLYHFVESGIWQKWRAKGIQYLHFVLVDNPLADPFDPNLLGFHSLAGADVTVKCTPRLRPLEKVGVLVETEGKVRVIEYTELSEQERWARNSDGSLKHVCANLSLFCISMEFVQEAAKLNDQLPLHPAFKSVKYLSKDSIVQMSEQPMAWKFEKYIFDMLPFAKKVNAILYPRESCFAPLKNFEGPDSPATVKDALEKNDRRIYQELTGTEVPSRTFELSQQFYYPTQTLIEKWKGRALPNELYIEP